MTMILTQLELEENIERKKWLIIWEFFVSNAAIQSQSIWVYLPQINWLSQNIEIRAKSQWSLAEIHRNKWHLNEFMSHRGFCKFCKWSKLGLRKIRPTCNVLRQSDKFHETVFQLDTHKARKYFELYYVSLFFLFIIMTYCLIYTSLNDAKLFLGGSFW